MCMIDGCDEMVEVLQSRKPVARKVHKCHECRRDIQPGERYEYHAGLLDGGWVTYKTCQQCLSVREWLIQVCSGWVYGQIGEDLLEHFWEGYGIWLARAYLGVRDKWRRRDGSLMPPMTLPDNLPVG